MITYLVTGGRDYSDLHTIERVLTSLPHRPDLIIHGGAPGADMSVDWAARKMGIHTARIDALWDAFGKGAGPRRNKVMAAMAETLDVVKCLAFPGGRGTANMVAQALEHGIEVEEVGR